MKNLNSCLKIINYLNYLRLENIDLIVSDVLFIFWSGLINKFKNTLKIQF